MEVARTPEERFSHLVEYPFDPHYLDVQDGEGNSVRMHYISEGEGDLTVLLLHGQPSWSYLYRKVIPHLRGCGARVLAPDLIGFGKSDKPVNRLDYTYTRHTQWLENFLNQLAPKNLVMFCQDWGGLLGLRIAGLQPERFAAIVAANTGLPTGAQKMPEEWHAFKRLCSEASRLPFGRLIQSGCTTKLSAEVRAGYEAPYPEERFVAGARQFPSLIPLDPEDAEGKINQKAFEGLREFDRPFITAFSDEDPITRKGDLFMKRFIKGAKGQNHVTISGGGHFLQEDRPEEVAAVIRQAIAVAVKS